MAGKRLSGRNGGRNGSGSVPSRSYLFTVRLWAEEIGQGQVEWRGRVQHVTSREAHYFRDWPTLITYLLQMLPQAQSQPKESRAIEPSEPETTGQHLPNLESIQKIKR